ncbi:MAG: O-antigen ligase family protein [Bacteroidales bacterium]|nr:O-antigen ligase family protein [Candidatus Colimorpha onthohippi]
MLCLLAVSMNLSVFLANLSWFLLLVNWVVEGGWRQKFSAFGSRHLLQAFLVMWGLLLVSIIWSADSICALHELRCALPLLVVPLVVLTSPPLAARERWIVVCLYVLAVLVVSLIAMVRYVAMPGLPYRQLVPFVSHIRFSLNVCLVVCIVMHKLLTALRHVTRRTLFLTASMALFVLWGLLFLYVQRSYTAAVALLVVLVVEVYMFRWRIEDRRLRNIVCWGVVAGIAAVVGMVVYYGVEYYYQDNRLAASPLPEYTLRGNPYTHQPKGCVENGAPVSNYLCTEELKSQWHRYSSMSLYDTTATGYTVYPTLVRYLNSKGLTKDSAGLTGLTQQDIRYVEQGIANCVYVEQSPRRMVYQWLFEWEQYRVYGKLVGSSMGERIALWINGLGVWAGSPLIGVGIGDVASESHLRLEATKSQLAGTQKHIHNQYITFLAAVGLVGIVLMAFFFGRVRIRRCTERAPLVVAYIVIVLVSFVSEDTLDTLAGILFCTVPIVFFYERQ